MKVLVTAAIACLLASGAIADEKKQKAPRLMTDAQMDQVVAGNHVVRLVMLSTGKTEMPAESAMLATERAGSIDGAGKDRSAIVALLQ